IRTKINGRRDGRKSGGIRFGVGSLAHLLKNRFYIGEITYRGEMHHGEHEPILTRDLFEAVQAKRVSNAVARHVRLRGSAALLAGCLFDERGHRMSPTHANKRAVRYRYYVSHAILQNRKAEAGSIARVPAPEIETLVCDSVRRHLAAMDETEPQTALADRELVQRHVARVIVKPQALDVWLIPTCEASAQAEDLRLKMRIARSKCLPMPWTRAGVRLIPEGHSANRSLSAIEPVSATAKRKLEDGEQRPAPETYHARAEIPKITGQRLGSASVTRGNVAGSHTPGNITPETRLPG